MKKMILALSLIILSLTSCTPEDDESAIVINTAPQIPTTSGSYIRTGIILEMFIYRKEFFLKTNKSINNLKVKEEDYNKSKIGYKIVYIESPLQIISITPN